MMRKAFSLVEISLYMAMVLLICSGVLYFLLTVSQSRAKAGTISEVQAIERIIFDEVSSLIAGAVSVNWSASELDQAEGSLVLINRLGQVVVMEVDGQGRMMISYDGESEPMNDGLIKIKQWRLTKIDDKTVMINLQLDYLDGLAPWGYSASWRSAFSINN